MTPYGEILSSNTSDSFHFIRPSAALMLFIANIRAALSHVRKVAEQSPSPDRWKTLLDYIEARIIPHRPRKLLKTCALLASDCGF